MNFQFKLRQPLLKFLRPRDRQRFPGCHSGLMGEKHAAAAGCGIGCRAGSQPPSPMSASCNDVANSGGKSMQTFPRRALIFFLSLGMASAQAVTGGIVGSVTDSSGGAMAQAEITLISITTGVQRTVPTSHSGEFVIDGLEPGEYSISVKASGFKTLERKGIRLSPSERLALGTLSLAVGAIDQQITVTAEGRHRTDWKFGTLVFHHRRTNRGTPRLWAHRYQPGSHRAGSGGPGRREYPQPRGHQRDGLQCRRQPHHCQ